MTAPISQRAIASLAILKVNSDRGSDYISNFVPFVAECLRRSTHDVVSITQLQADLRAEFGIDVPQGPLRTILDRACRAGYAERSERVYKRRPDALERLDLTETRSRILREVSALVEKLEAFSGSILATRWSGDEAERALLHYLADRGTSVLASQSGDIPIALPAGRPADADYVVSAFVSRLSTKDPEGFGFLTTAVKGSVLSSVLYFDDFGSIGQQFANLQVFLDTGVLLQALGRLGPERQAASLELIDLAKTLGAQLSYFPETLRELEGIHGFTVHCLDQRHGTRHVLWGASDYLVAHGYTASDVRLMIEHLEDDLEAAGIFRQERPPHLVALTVDERALEEVLRLRVKYRGPEPLQHDHDALTAIHRLRGGGVVMKIETSRAIFVTTNTALARASVGFFRDHYGVRSFAPLCMPDHQFATLAWLKKPLAAPDLPTKYVLADALAGLNPPELLWRAYVREINRLESRGQISTTDFVVLRYAPAAREALMGITFGGGRPFLEGSVPEILARARAAERADADERAGVEAKARKQAELDLADERRHSDEERLRFAAERRAEASKVADAARLVAERADIAFADRRRRFQDAGDSVGRLSRYALVALYLALAILHLYPLVPGKPVGDLPLAFAANLVVAIALVIVGILAAIFVARGGSIVSAYRPIETRISDWVAEALARRFDPEARPLDRDIAETPGDS